jgi:long-subunit acyl-CoA synthetase (AMP-forming)
MLPDEAPAAFRAPTVCAGFQASVGERGDALALRTKGGAHEISWREYGARVRRLAGGLAALGVRPGDTVAILLTNRPEFQLIDSAAMHLGAVPFSIYWTSATEQIAYLLADSGARVAITEAAFAARLDEARAGTRCETVVRAEELGALEAMAPPAGWDFDAAWRAVTPDSLLTIIYTSGTTGNPKGVEITHGNMMHELRALLVGRDIGANGRSISYLPHAHIADRVSAHYLPMMLGSAVTTCPDPRQLFEYVTDVRPTEFTGMPRVWEKLKAALEARFAGEPPERKAAIHGAIAASLQKVKLEQAGQPVPEPLAVGVARAEAMIFAPLRDKLGFGETKTYYVGAAPTPREVLEFFHAIGVRIAEVWGMSELSCVATAMPKDRIKLGTVGVALPGVELRIADDGEILVRGPIIMRGYRNNPAQTAETIDADGWLHTGDIGALDAEGFLSIVDRKKELIINSGGKNMSPANIEARIKTSSPLIGQCCVIGDNRPYNVALLVLDADGARARGVPHDPDAPEVRAEIARAIDDANTHLSRVEQVKRYAILAAEWLPGGDELTPTMKLRRKPIAHKYAAQIEALYAE